MKGSEKYSLHASIVAVTASGTAYGWMKYMLTSDDPFSVVNHPWQGIMLDAHVLSAPILLLVFGMLLRSHVLRHLSGTPVNRRTGLVSLVTFALMAASGYLLQVTTSEDWSRAWLWLHIASGSFFVVAYLTHVLIGLRLSARRLTSWERVA